MFGGIYNSNKGIEGSYIVLKTRMLGGLREKILNAKRMKFMQNNYQRIWNWKFINLEWKGVKINKVN